MPTEPGGISGAWSGRSMTAGAELGMSLTGLRITEFSRCADGLIPRFRDRRPSPRERSLVARLFLGFEAVD